MSVNGIANQLGVSGLDSSVDMRASARELNKPTKHYEENAVSGFIRGAGQKDGPTAEQAFDLFKALGDLFSGANQPQANGPDAANKFDLGAILSSIFDFAGKQVDKAGGLPKAAHHDGGQVRVAVSGETGDEHFKAKGSASAEAHAKADTFSETFLDGSGVGVRGGAEASAGVSAEAAGSVVTDIGSIDGRAKVSAEVYARLYGEARAGPDGVSASGRAEAGAMAKGEAETNLQVADGIIAGHADARAESGTGGRATARAAVSFDPPEAVVNAKAEAFAGARAGYSAKGGVAGVGYGVDMEVWAGAGAKIELNGGLEKDGKFKIQFSIGVAAGVGAMMKFNLEFDTKVFGKVVGDLVGKAGDIVGDIFGAVAGLFDGGSGKGAHAGKALAAAIKQIAPLVGQMAASSAKKEFDAHRAELEPKAKHEPEASDHGEQPRKDPIHRSGHSDTLLEGKLS